MWLRTSDRTLVVPLSYKRFGIPRGVMIDLSRYEETFNCTLDPWRKTPPSYVWAFGGDGQVWHVKRYRTLATAARVVAAIAAIRGTAKLTLLPSVQVPRTGGTMAFNDLVMKQLELIRSIGQDNMFDKHAVTTTAAMLGMSELLTVLSDTNVRYTDLLTEFGTWRYQVVLCGVCGRFHAPRDRCGHFTGGTHATGSDSSGDTSHGRLDGDS